MKSENRVILVTGGTGALGRCVTAFFADQSEHVHATWINREEADEARAALGVLSDRVHFHKCDVTSEIGVRDLFAAIEQSTGPVSILANVVGGFAGGSIEETEVATYRRMIDLNITSAYLCCRSAIPPMKRRGWGRIINVAAAPAITGAGANMTAYSAAKAAVWNLTQSLAAEIRGTGITCNAVVPTTIDTPANRLAMPKSDPSAWTDPVDIAAVVGFLASETAGVVSGSALRLTARS